MRPVGTSLARPSRVANMDLRGHGRSSLDVIEYTKTDIVEDMLAVTDAAGLRNPVLIGHSLGAKFVLEFAHQHPARTRAVVLLDTSIVESRQRQATRLIESERGLTEELRSRLDRMFRADDLSALRRRTTEVMLQMPRDSSTAALRAGDSVDTATALASCEMPVLYIAASRPGEDPQLMRQLNPSIYFGQVVGSGHFVQFDALAQVSAMINRFVQLYVRA
jgi:pimeloyl-ACP methyl ester carboxylesterase